MINDSIIQKTAKLARINLSATEREEFSQSLGEVTEWFNNLQNLNTEKLAPFEFTYGENKADGLRTRPDEVQQSKQSSGSDSNSVIPVAGELLDNAPDQEHNYFAVPKFVKK